MLPSAITHSTKTQQDSTTPGLASLLSHPIQAEFTTLPMDLGLIAEEVAKVYPELVIRDAAGKIQGVRYDELAPMLLNEVQKQNRVNAAQAAEIHELKQRQKQFATQAELNDLKQQLQAALDVLHLKEQLVARR